MGKTKPFKVEKRYFEKQIRNLVKKQTRKEKHKFEEITKAQRSVAIEDEGTSVGVSEKGKTRKIDLKNLKRRSGMRLESLFGVTRMDR